MDLLFRICLLMILQCIFGEGSLSGCWNDESSLICFEGNEEEFKYCFRKLPISSVKIMYSEISTEYVINEIQQNGNGNKLYNLTITNYLNEDEVVYLMSQEIRPVWWNFSGNELTDITFLNNVQRNYGLSNICLARNNFKHLKRVNYPISMLDLSHCNVRYIDSDTFVNSLAYELKLNDNKITNLNGSLNYFELRRVDLSNNLITNIVKSDFGNEIVFINLNGNKIKSIDVDSLGYMTDLLLGHNYLKDLCKNKSSPLSIGTLDLTKNEIHFVNFLELKQVSMSHLILDDNELNLLLPYSFKNYWFTGPSDYELSLINSSINHISENAFYGLQLHVLNVSHNFIKILHSDAFNNTRIKVLDLSQNNVSLIEKDAFHGSKIEKIILKGNKLETIDFNVFCPTSTLELVLSHNKIIYFDRLFCKLTIEKVDLNNNLITSLLSSTYSSLSEMGNFNQLTDLNFSRNRISKIEPFEGKSFSKIKILDLSYNLLEVVEFGTFVKLKNMEKLLIHNNPLKTLDPLSFSNSMKLKYLYITLDGILKEKQFTNLGFLQTLIFINSRISLIEKHCFNGLIRLEKNIFVNSTVNDVEIDSFIGLPSLLFSDFNIIFKNVTSLRQGMFRGLESLEVININYCKVRNISYYAFDGAGNLKSLSLVHNNISQLSIGTFHNLKSLKYLNLSSNAIKEIRPGVFTELKNLEVLDLSFNSIQVIKNEVILPLKFLNTLNLSYNKIIELEHVNMLTLLPRLVNLGISGNLWKCNYLVGLLGNITLRNIDYSPKSDLVVQAENIDGIYCVDVCRFILCLHDASSYL